MITVKELKKVLNDYPDDAEVTVYEGEGNGIIINKGDEYGWIEVGYDNEERFSYRDEKLTKY